MRNIGENIAFAGVRNAFRRSEVNDNAMTSDNVNIANCQLPTEDCERNREIQRIANPILNQHSLKVNDDKWENTEIKRCQNRAEENTWRNTKKLGSLLGDYEDMKRRIQLSTATMQSVAKIWPNKKVKLQDRLKIYKCIVKSVLTYNICTWGLTKAQLAELDRAHQKQIRKVFNAPFKRNAHVYRDSNEPLRIEMKEKRWRAFGHILRLDNEAPCQQAMVYYFDPPQDAKYSGRKRITLPVVLDEDLKETAKSKDTVSQI